MVKTVNCSIVGQKSRGGNTYAATSVYMGYGNGTTHYEYVLSFTTGDFVGESKSITFNIKMGNSSQGATRTYRWALLNSDSSVVGRDTSVNLYFDKHVEVTDPNQLAQGTVTWTDMNKDTHKVLTVEASELKANTNYFLVLWAYSTNPTSFVTVSNTQYHGDILVEYDSSYTISENHYCKTASGELEWFDTVTLTVEPGSYYTPVLRIPPSTNTQKGATFTAWLSDWSEEVGSGTAGIDEIAVNANLIVEIYYPPAGGYVYYNDDGTVVKCAVIRNCGGVATRCDIYCNRDGSAVKV